MVKDMYHGTLAVRAAQGSGLPVALGITVTIDEADGLVYLRDEKIPAVDALAEWLELCPNIVCVNIMHSPAEYCVRALRAIRGAWGGRTGVYPNNGNAMSWPEWNEGDLTPEALVAFAAEWAQEGATLIGGCCGIGPAHISALSAHFNIANTKL